MARKRKRKRRSKGADPEAAEAARPPADPGHEGASESDAEVGAGDVARAEPGESVEAVGSNHPAAPPALAGRQAAFVVGLVVGAALVVGAVASPSGAGALRYPALWTIARILLGLSGLFCLVVAWQDRGGARRSPGLVWATLAFGVAGLLAAYGREAALHRGAFDGLNEHLLGVPSSLAFVMMAATARWRHDAAAATGRARLGFVAALVWATAVLVLPSYTLGEGRVALLQGFARLGAADLATLTSGLALVASGLSVAAGWVAVVAGGAWASTGERLAVLGAAAIMLHHLLAGFSSPLGPLSGLVMAGGLTAVVLAGRRLVAAAPSDARVRLSVARLADVTLPATVLAVFLLLKTHGMGPSNTDENIYFYMARELGEGRWPYVDYFFAHPPLHVVVPGAFFAVFGYSFTAAKLFSVGATALAGYAIWRIGREHFGRTAGVFAAVLFLFAAETLKASTNMTGVNLTTMWLVLGLWQALRGRGLTAGVLFGLAATTGFYSMAAVCAMLALGLFRWPPQAPSWRRRLRFGTRQVLGFVAVCGTINALFYMSAGTDFIEGVYSYHGLKAFQDPDMWELFGGEHGFFAALLHNIGVVIDGRAFTKDFYYHSYLWMGLLSAPALGVAAWLSTRAGRAAPHRLFSLPRLWSDGSHGVAAVLWLVGVALFVQYAMFRELYSFYWVLIYPVLALLVAYVAVFVVRLLHEQLGERPWPNIVHASVAVLVLGILGAYRPLANHVRMVFPGELERAASRNDYVWKDAPVLPALSGVVRTLFWEDFRLRGGTEPGYRHYLWSKKRNFATLPEVAGFIRENSDPHETIAGASTAAPLVAIAAGRKLAAGEADTNNKRFKSGLLKERTYWEAICADNIRFIVSTPRSYFTEQRMRSLPTARKWFEKRRTFLDPELRYGGTFPISIYERVGSPPQGGGVCRWES